MFSKAESYVVLLLCDVFMNSLGLVFMEVVLFCFGAPSLKVTRPAS